MNDFLQSIRNGNYSKDNRQRYNSQKPRRSYDNSNGNYSRGNGNERKFRPKKDFHQNDEAFKGIKEVLDTIAKNQETAMSIAERRAIAEERKAAAFEFIASTLGDFSPVQEPVKETVKEPVKETAEETVEVFAEKEATIQQTEPAEATETAKTSETAETAEISPAKSYEIIKNSDKEINKDEILAMILSMRNDGSTYNEIANHLAGLDLPTFSGRGKWHAQTIHRLCQNL